MPDYSYLGIDKEAYFPKLKRENYRVTSDYTARYNCIAHAANDPTRWWWPDEGFPGVFWPAGIDAVETVEAFVQAYSTLGYDSCDHAELETDFIKVAIYVDGDGVPTHAARQLPNGMWTSKLGQWEDIEHRTLHDLEDDGRGLGYGRSAVFLKMRANAP